MRIKRTELVGAQEHLSLQVEPGDLPLRNIEVLSKRIAVDLRVSGVGPDFDINGLVRLRLKETCDRCLDPYETNVETQFRLLLTEKESLWTGEQDADVYPFPASAPDFDFGPAIRDAIELDRPMKRICAEECKGLCPRCGINLNRRQCDCETTQVDERWAVLKELDLSKMEQQDGITQEKTVKSTK